MIVATQELEKSLRSKESALYNRVLDIIKSKKKVRAYGRASS